MKKLLLFMIAAFLIFGLTLNAKTKDEAFTTDPTSLAPRQLFNPSVTQPVVTPNPFRDPDYLS